MLLDGFQGVSHWRVLKGSLNSISMEFQWNLKELGRVVQRCFKDVSRVF